jgi:hypothetical protein
MYFRLLPDVVMLLAVGKMQGDQIIPEVYLFATATEHVM